MAILALGLIVAAAPLLQTHNSAALSASSISKTEGSTAGGDEIIIKGEGFIKDQMDGIWEVIEFQPSACRSSESLSPGSSIIVTKSGLMFEQSYDDDDNRSLVSLTEKYDLGIVNSIHDVGSVKIIHTKDGRVHSISYAGCGGPGEDRVSIDVDMLESRDNHIIGKGPDGELYIKSGSEYYSIKSSARSAYPLKLEFDEPVVSVDRNIFTMQSGKRILVNDTRLIDITDNIGMERIIQSDADPYTVVLSSGKIITYYWFNTEFTINNRLVDLLNGEEIQRIFGDPTGGFILTKSGKPFVVSNDWDENINDSVLSLKKIDTPSDIDEIVDGVIYLKDGTIFGMLDPYSDGGIQTELPEQFCQTFEGDRVAQALSGYYYSDGIFEIEGQLLVARSGKMYVGGTKYDYVTGEDEEILLLLDYGLLPGDSIKSFGADGNITTDFGDILNIATYDGVSFKIEDRTSELTKGLPLVPTNQVMRLYFGGVEATSFEIIDANTIRAIVPANNTGLYNISFLARGSSAPYETSLSYRYTGSNNGSGGGSNSEGGLPHITAPNTGYRRS